MAEEKKEEKPAEAKAAATPAPAASATPAAEKKEAVAANPHTNNIGVGVKKEKPSNCASCNKSIKNKRWYYRNGKFYCTKTCWQEVSKKQASKTSQ